MKKDYNKEKEIEELKHKFHMEELAYIRETEKIKHNNDMELQRIRSAEIRKTLDRKEWYRLKEGGN